VPLEDVFRVLSRLKDGKDLKRGLLGISPQGADVYNSAPVIGAIQPDSAAARTGLAIGDKITEINGKSVPNYSTLQHIMGPLYEGDEIDLKLVRGEKEMEFKKIKLIGLVTAYVNAFLGVLPMRDDPGPGVEVRFVYPKSPADAAGIKVGDRIMKLGSGTPAPIQNRAALLTAIQRLNPGVEIKVELKRKDGGKVETVSAKLIAMPEDLPEKLPLPSSAGKALEGQPKPKDPKDPFPPKKDPFPPKGPLSNVRAALADDKEEEDKKKDKKIETGFMTRTDQALGREYWVFVPDNYDPNVSHGLIVWFHPAKEGGKDGEKMMKTFRDFAEDNHFIVMGPKSGNANGWVASETEQVMHDVKAVIGQYTIDRARVVAHGMGNGGQMAFYVGFNARDVFRGVATLGATLGNPPKDNVANLPLSFFISAGDKDPLLKDIVESKDLLKEKRFPVIFREMKESGKEYFDLQTFTDFLAWLDSLDRI
jgi:predicted esterase